MSGPEGEPTLDYLPHPAFTHVYDFPFDQWPQLWDSLNFDLFRPFITTEGLNPALATSFTTFLEELFQASKIFWRPASCKRIQDIHPLAEGILGSMNNSLFTDIVPQTHEQSHFWLKLNTTDEANPSLIVDPTGVLYGGKHEIPYFGPLKGVQKPFAKIVYSESQNLGPLGYRIPRRGPV